MKSLHARTIALVNNRAILAAVLAATQLIDENWYNVLYGRITGQSGPKSQTACVNNGPRRESRSSVGVMPRVRPYIILWCAEAISTL